MSRWIALAALLFAAGALAQPEAIVLVATPEIEDPNFGQSVVLVTHTPSGEMVGVVLNRPTRLRFVDVAPEFPHAAEYQGPVFEGGPVLKRVIVALFRTATPPSAAAFPVLPDIFLSMHPQNIAALLERPRPDVRFFAGFSGWAPGQLEAEIADGRWHVLPVSADLLFRDDTSTLWRELVARTRSRRAIYFLE